MGEVTENTLGVHSRCATLTVPTGIEFKFEPGQQPLMRIFPAHDTTPPDGWEGRMQIRIHVYDACMAMRRGTIYEGRYEDFLKPQCPEDNHYHPQVGSVRAMSGDVIQVMLESPDVVIDPTRTRFRLQVWNMIRTLKKESKQMKRPKNTTVRYYPGDMYVIDKHGYIIGTERPDGEYRPIGNREVPPGEKVRRAGPYNQDKKAWWSTCRRNRNSSR
jgi:hypothetical protein